MRGTKKTRIHVNGEERGRCSSVCDFFLFLPPRGPPLSTAREPAHPRTVSCTLSWTRTSLFSSLSPPPHFYLALPQARRTKQSAGTYMSLSRRASVGRPTHARLSSLGPLSVCIFAPTSAPPHQARLSPWRVCATKATSPETEKKKKKKKNPSCSSSFFALFTFYHTLFFFLSPAAVGWVFYFLLEKALRFESRPFVLFLFSFATPPRRQRG